MALWKSNYLATLIYYQISLQLTLISGQQLLSDIHNPSSIIQTTRLPPQIAYAGEELIIHMADVFQHESQKLNFFLYTLDNVDLYPFHNADLTSNDDDTTNDIGGESFNPHQLTHTDAHSKNSTYHIIPQPTWIEFDHTIPRITVRPPKDISGLKHAYTLNIMARTISGMEVNDDEITLIVAKSCHKRCFHEFGFGCEDWEFWLIITGIDGFLMLTLGFILRTVIEYLYEKRAVMLKQRRFDRKLQWGESSSSSDSDAGAAGTELMSFLSTKKKTNTRLRRRRRGAGKKRNFFDSDSDEDWDAIRHLPWYKRCQYWWCVKQKWRHYLPD